MSRKPFSVMVFILPLLLLSAQACFGADFMEVNGKIVMEAEHYSGMRASQDGGNVSWGLRNDVDHFLEGPTFNGQYMYVGTNPISANYGNFSQNVLDKAPRLDYTINAVTGGTYYIWVRGNENMGNSVFLVADFQLTAAAVKGYGDWVWWNGDQFSTLVVRVTLTPGEHTISIYQREANCGLDQIILTTDPAFVPAPPQPPIVDVQTKAHDPQPEHSATGIPVNTTLTWKTGFNPNDPNVPNPAITGHHLWLSIPYDLANPPTSPDWSDPGVQIIELPADVNPADGNVDAIVSYSLVLQRAALYFWIVDESLGATHLRDWDNIIAGTTWSFKTDASAPVADAGSSIVTWLKGGTTVVNLNGTVTDATGDLTSILWSVAGSPSSSAVTIADTSSAATTATLTQTGQYVLQLYAKDAAQNESSDLMEIRVYSDRCQAAKNNPKGYTAPQYDFNNDCKVDLVDFSMFANIWLNDTSLATDTLYDPDTISLPPTLITQGIVITEIMYNANVPDEDREYLELYNNSLEPVNLGGWSIAEAINYTFAANTILEPQEYLVVARNRDVFASLYPDSSIQVVGGYSKNLSNGGETILLLNPGGGVVDQVAYSDDSPWPQAADGNGPALELIHPALENNYARSWAASLSGGTPGRPNSAAQNDPAPIVEVQRHAPLIPEPASTVTVTAWITDDMTPDRVELFYRLGSGTWSSVPMHADSNPAANLLWEGTLPAQAQGTIVEFYVKAIDTAGQTGYGPLLAPQQNGLYQVDSQVNSTIHETYRVVLTSADYDWLFARSVTSDELINCTFMAGQDIRYNAGIRFRGNSSRNFPPPKNYRVEFNWTDIPFRGLERLNLNGVNDDPRNQYPDMCIASHEFGHDFLDRANQLTLDHKLISMVTNNQFWPDYIYVSAIDDVFARLKFPGDDGNLYRCITYGGKGADLDYRGTDPNAYRPNYYKHTNESVDDWSDLIELTDVLNNTPDELYARRVSEIVDVEQWMGFFAALNLISYLEGGIHAGQGTEYSMYRRESDGRFVMIPWDMDENFHNPNQPLFPQTLPAVKRFIQHPDHIDLYYAAFRRLLDGPFSVEQMHLATERYRGILPDEFLDQIEVFVVQRRAYVLSRLP